MVGETFGSYRVTRKIGEGGMGAVYLAEHTLLGRKAALKVLLPEHSRNQDLIDRFFNEAKTAAGLKHPALVDVFDFGIHPSGSAYLVMDFLEGESLGARLARVAPLPNELVMDFSRQIARGMEAAHSQGIVHRDLKPDNVFLVPDAEDPNHEQVKILDFGIAKLLSRPKGSRGATSTGMVLGTPLFMAPEQCRGAGVVDHRADIYSLGCIMYFMLCARPPFDYPGVGEILGAHLHEPVTPPRTLNPAIPEPLEAIVLRALVKNPDERYQTMAALATDLGRLMGITGSPSQIPFQAPAPTVALPTAPTTLSKAASEIRRAAPPVAPAPVRAKSRTTMIAIAAAFIGGAAVAAVAVVRSRSSTRTPVAERAQDRHASPQPAPVKKPAVIAPTAAPDAADVVAQTPASPPTPTPPDAAVAVRRPEGKPENRRPASREPVELYSRGVAQLARGHEMEAYESFRGYLRGDGLLPSRRADAERYVIGLQRKFAEIEVSCEVSGANVFVDGRFVGRTPLARSIVLPGGAHLLQLTKDGYKPASQNFRVAPGERKPFVFHLPR